MIEVYEDTAGEWRWRYRAKNGKITCDGGEGYSSKSNAVRAVRRQGWSRRVGRTNHVWPTVQNGDYRRG
jgi:uncharacterized protein YegP (UPF0339 family)